MRKVTLEFPVVGYAEVQIEVEDDLSDDDVLDLVRNDELEVVYDGHSHAEILTPLLDLREYQTLSNYVPFVLGVVD